MTHIITKPVPWKNDDWQYHLKNAVTNCSELARLTGLDEGDLDWDENPSFDLRVPKTYIKRMKFGDPTDPLLLQVAPRKVESAIVDGFIDDPLNEIDASKSPGLIKKYEERALIITTAACAVNCRYCFRRHFPYENHRNNFESQTLKEIANDSSIKEAILSGGDPLIMTDSSLIRLMQKIVDIPHVRRLRIHTRLPVVIPSRVTNSLLKYFSTLNCPLIIVLHFNHANEIGSDTQAALTSLASTGATLLNQSVLLRGVNDNPETLASLSESLFHTGVLPYYLHLLDPVTGTSHFDIEKEEASRIFSSLQEILPGYLVPRLVREVAGKKAKQLEK